MLKQIFIAFFVISIINSCSVTKNQLPENEENMHKGVNKMQIEQYILYGSIIDSLNNLETDDSNVDFEKIPIFVVREGNKDFEQVLFSIFPGASEGKSDEFYFGDRSILNEIDTLKRSSSLKKKNFLIETYLPHDGSKLTQISCVKLKDNSLDLALGELKQNYQNLSLISLFDPAPRLDAIILYARLKEDFERLLSGKGCKAEMQQLQNLSSKEPRISEESLYDFMNEYVSTKWFLVFGDFKLDVAINEKNACEVSDKILYLKQYDLRRGNSTTIYRTYSIFKLQD